MKKYLTSVIAIHNVEGKLGKWPGPIIEAESFEAAQEWCLKNTQYLFVEQEIMEARKEDNSDFQLNWPTQLATNYSQLKMKSAIHKNTSHPKAALLIYNQSGSNIVFCINYPIFNTI